jgi:PIN domain nuclease of toxin-antitoxin system
VIWSVDKPSQLSPLEAVALQDPANELYLSAASIWEISIKAGLGRLILTLPFRQWMNQAIVDLNLSLLPITVEYADMQSVLPDHHRDPFDRLIIAQALTDSIQIVSADPVFNLYGVARLW